MNAIKYISFFFFIFIGCAVADPVSPPSPFERQCKDTVELYLIAPATIKYVQFSSAAPANIIGDKVHHYFSVVFDASNEYGVPIRRVWQCDSFATYNSDTGENDVVFTILSGDGIDRLGQQERVLREMKELIRELEARQIAP
ncbi:hypothetical protein [Zavarzinia sp.]|uniref:hypothetical protein n=1 Tax=Zavarzinia sp. TaxID=2027920 RepID=UPI003BB58B35